MQCGYDTTPQDLQIKTSTTPRMLTYATTKASFWAILSLNKQDTHFASFGFHLLFVGIGKGKQNLNVCQCGNLLEFGMSS